MSNYKPTTKDLQVKAKYWLIQEIKRLCEDASNQIMQAAADKKRLQIKVTDYKVVGEELDKVVKQKINKMSDMSNEIVNATRKANNALHREEHLKGDLAQAREVIRRLIHGYWLLERLMPERHVEGIQELRKAAEKA